MTMPHLMNCAHSSDSWCLECVKAEHDFREKESIDARLAILADVISFAKSMVGSIPCTCATTVSTIANMEMHLTTLERIRYGVNWKHVRNNQS